MYAGGGKDGSSKGERKIFFANHYPQYNQYKQQPKGPRHDFPKFDGTNTCAWIKKFDKYFKLCHISEEEKVEVASLYFTGKADTWLENMEFDLEDISWSKFCKKIKRGLQRNPLMMLSRSSMA
jgi:hypothetical protein